MWLVDIFCWAFSTLGLNLGIEFGSTTKVHSNIKIRMQKKKKKRGCQLPLLLNSCVTNDKLRFPKGVIKVLEIGILLVVANVHN